MSIQRPWHGTYTSPVSAALFLNSPPSPKDATLLRAAISSISDTITSLDHNISQQEQILRGLIEQKEVAIAFREDHARSLNPMLCVPPEIWAEIFEYACGWFLYDSARMRSVASSSCPDSLNPRNPIMTLDRICMSWRQILRSTPKMWARLHLKESLEKGYNEDLAVTLLSRSLEYSHNYNLDVAFRTESISPSSQLVNRVMDMLMQHRHRWRSIALYDTKEQLLNTALSASMLLNAVSQFPSLKFLAWGSGSINEMSLRLPKLDDCLPKLQHVVFWYKCPDIAFIPWTQVIDVSLLGVAATDVSRVFQELSSALRIFVIFRRGEVDPPILKCTLPCVRHLILGHWNLRFYTTVKMPKLRHLEIADIHQNLDDVLIHVSSFIRNSGCQLVSFKNTRYTAIGVPPALAQFELACSGFLSSVPHLNTLHLDCSPRHIGAHNAVTLLGLLGKRQDPSGLPFYCPDLCDLQLKPKDWTQYRDTIEEIRRLRHQARSRI